MLKNLSIKRQQGFTLVELLVAIAIIAILAVIGLTVFTGLQKSARDATRRSDIQSISKALEANYNTTTALYIPLAGTQFAGGVVPTDPLDTTSNCNTKYCGYCIGWQTGGTTPPTGGPVTGANNCGAGTAGTNKVAAGQPAITASSYIVCANLETGPGTNTPNQDWYCQGSQR